MAIAGKVAILPKGEWDSAVTYEKLDAVSYDNALYIAKKPSVGQVPTDGEYWMFCLQSIDYAEFEKIINGTTTVGIADKAINDKNGDDIVDTYAKKNDLTNFQNKDGDSKDNIVTFTSADSTASDAWTDVAVLATGEKHSSLFAKISTMFKNIRYIYTHFIKSENILETLEEIVANTQSGKVAGSLAVKELNSNLSNSNKRIDSITNGKGLISYASLGTLEHGVYRTNELTANNSPSGSDTDGILIVLPCIYSSQLCVQIFWGYNTKQVHMRICWYGSYQDWIKLSQ